MENIQIVQIVVVFYKNLETFAKLAFKYRFNKI